MKKVVYKEGKAQEFMARQKTVKHQNLPPVSTFLFKNVQFSSYYIQQVYLRYSYLWAEDRNQQIQEFVASKPFIYEIREKFNEYEELFIEIETLPNFHIIGPLRINTSN